MIMFEVHASMKGEREMFYLMTHSTHFIYGYMEPDIWLRTILIVRKETRCRHIGYSYQLTARVLLYAPSHRQDNTYHCLCYTSRGALAGTRNSSMGASMKCKTALYLRMKPFILACVKWFCISYMHEPQTLSLSILIFPNINMSLLLISLK